MAFVLYSIAFFLQRKLRLPVRPPLLALTSGLAQAINRWSFEKSGLVWLFLIVLLALCALGTSSLLRISDHNVYQFLYHTEVLLILLLVMSDGGAHEAMASFYQRWRAGDVAGVRAILASVKGETNAGASSMAVCYREFFRRYLDNTYKNFLAVLLYFAVLGLPLVLMYRLLDLLSEGDGVPSVRSRAGQLLAVLDWLPVRVVGLLLMVRRPELLREWFAQVFWSGLDSSRVLLISFQLVIGPAFAGKPDRMTERVLTSHCGQTQKWAAAPGETISIDLIRNTLNRLFVQLFLFWGIAEAGGFAWERWGMG